MLTIDLFEDHNNEPVFIQALRDFLPVALKVLNLKQIPKIILKKELHDTNVPTFGRFTNDEKVVYCVINNRHPNDILRTLAHELAHYGQGEEHELSSGSWHTGSPVENDAHVKAGIIMRHFNTEYPKYLKAAPIVLPESWSQKYKKSINCSNPKGFSQKAHCAGRKKHTNEAEQKPKLYTGEELDIRVHLLSKQLGMSPAEVRRQYTDPMIKDGRIKLVPSKVQEDQNKCPPATQDIGLNLKNRQKAINEYGYGPLNPLEPNEKFWLKKQQMWQLDSIDVAKKSLCGNCAAFDVSKDSIACIEQGIGDDSGSENPHDVVEAGDLGYCRFLKFKCASLRTCDAWVVGGPITESKHCDAKNAVPELKAALEKRKTELKNADAKVAYDKIDKIMTRIAQTYNLSGQKLHDLWVERYGEIPDTWVLDESKENKPVTIHTNPYYRGATIGAGVKEQLPVTKMPIDQLQMWESDKTLRTKKVRDWVKNTLIPKLQDKGRLNPMIVWNRKGKHFVIDGNHRFLAYKAAGFKGDVPVRVVPQEMITINNKVLEPVDENFADGRGPGRPGDSQRHGIPKHATKAELEKASHSAGRKGQLARWQLNMRNGKKK